MLSQLRNSPHFPPFHPDTMIFSYDHRLYHHICLYDDPQILTFDDQHTFQTQCLLLSQILM